MKICAIESSCDETAIAIVEDGKAVLSSLVASQIKWHKAYGGVVPELASRMHAEKIHFLIEKAFSEAGLKFEEIDAFAVTYGPGLEGALLVGLSVAKSMAQALNKPLIPINHLHGHLYSVFLADTVPEFPFVSLIVSGGHTLLLHAKGHFDFRVLGTTRDDACGEAFDKVARLLGLGYPGGPIIEKIAIEGDEKVYAFPRAMLHDGLEFSFSGLKTAVAQTIVKIDVLDDSIKANIAASFQSAVKEILVHKALKACQQVAAKKLVVCGGVMSNQSISMAFQDACQGQNIGLFVPPKELCTDNAVMIAVAAHYRAKQALDANYQFLVAPQLQVTDT